MDAPYYDFYRISTTRVSHVAKLLWISAQVATIFIELMWTRFCISGIPFFISEIKLICNKTLQLLWMPAIYWELEITPNHVSLVNSFCKLWCTVIRHSCFVAATHDNSCKRVCLLASSLLAVQVPLNSCQLMLPLSTYANSYQLTLTLVNAFLHSSTCINFFHLMLPLSTHDKSSLANFRQILSGLLHYFDVY